MLFKEHWTTFNALFSTKKLKKWWENERQKIQSSKLWRELHKAWHSLYATWAAQHKNRVYQQHTQFAQISADYDFIKETYSTDYSFNESEKTNDTENEEQPDNTVELPNLIKNTDDSIARQPEIIVSKLEQKFALVKKCRLWHFRDGKSYGLQL